MNSYRHGCRAKSFHIPDAKLPQYQDLRKQIITEHQLPAVEAMTPAERIHFEQMAQSQWRMRCAEDLQQEMVDAFCAAHPEITDRDDVLTELLQNESRFVNLWAHEQKQEAKYFDAAKTLHNKESLAITNKVTSKPNLGIPYAPPAPSAVPPQTAQSQSDPPRPLRYFCAGASP